MTSRKDNSAASSKVCPEAIDEAALQHPSPGQSGLSFYEKSKYSNPSFLDRSIPTTKVPTLARTFLPIHPIRKVRPEYLTQTESPPRRLEAPQKLLVILDLNGTLFYKNKNTKAYTSRPFLDNFNEFLFTHFTVMVWSSARPESVGKMVEKGFGEHVKDLDRIWSRDFFGLHEADYHRRVLTVKDLEYVWNEMRRKQQQQQQEQQQISGSKDGGMQGAEDGVHGNVGSSAESPEGQHMGTPPPHAIPTTYDQTNTVIIDDSKEKTQLQPFNRLLIKEFVGEKDDIALLQVVAYLKEAMYYDNVSSFIRHHPFTTSVASQTDLVRSLFAECRINAKQMGLELPETNKQAGEQRKAKKKKKRRQQEPTQHYRPRRRL
ncbi:hypothetical protein BGZ73_004781 [Actinomortierella ambigua]|nr:hypothetical protein BGZ73_004781 [Actinomortierella ambigua]